MKEQEFKIKFQSLKDRKSWESKFDSGFITLLWDQVKNYPVVSFEKAVDELLGQHTCPTVSDILFLTRKHNYGTRTEHVMPANDCAYCDTKGIVLIENKFNNDFITHCESCNNGKTQKELSGNIMPSVTHALAAGFVPKSYRLARLYSGKDKPFKNIGCPWPASIEAIMLQIQRGWHQSVPKKFATSLRFSGLTEESAWTLYLAYSERKWTCPSVGPIIAKKSNSAALNRLAGRF